MILKFEEYIEPRKTQSGKMTPGKYKAAGVEYVAPRGAQIELGKEYECEVETTQNGNFKNHVVKNLFPVRQLEPQPVQPEKIAATREWSANAAQTFPAATTDKDRLIARHVALKAAVEFCVGQPQAAGDDPVSVAETFLGWLLDERQQTSSSLRRPDAPVVSPLSHPTR